MSLTSLTFLLFCIITLTIYFIVPKKIQWFVLLISSIIFLFWDNLGISTVLQAILILIPTYIFGRLIEKYQGSRKSKIFLFLGITIILCQLIYLKYTNLFFNTINHIGSLIGTDWNFAEVHRNSLIGISYYSLIMISYLIDIYRGACKAQKNVLKCALFMSYFPILTSRTFYKI